MTSKDAKHASKLIVSPWICSVQQFSVLMVRLVEGTGNKYIYIQIDMCDNYNGVNKHNVGGQLFSRDILISFPLIAQLPIKNRHLGRRDNKRR